MLLVEQGPIDITENNLHNNSLYLKTPATQGAKTSNKLAKKGQTGTDLGPAGKFLTVLL